MYSQEMMKFLLGYKKEETKPTKQEIELKEKNAKLWKKQLAYAMVLIDK